jgi:hypothetical protein
VKRALSLLLAGVVGIGVLAAVVISIRGRASSDTTGRLMVLHGVIGSEKQPFFSDAEVIRVFHDHGLDVRVDTAGSRQIATTFDLTHEDFAFPAGVRAAEKLPLTPAGDRVGRLLTSDPDLQRLAIKHGFRTNDNAAFNKFVAAHKVVLPQTLFNVIEPPTYETLESMISAIEQHMKGATK